MQTLRALWEQQPDATTVDGAVNADVFEAFMVQVLVPQLRPGETSEAWS